MSTLLPETKRYSRAGARIPAELLQTAILWELLRENYFFEKGLTEKATNAAQMRVYLEQRSTSEL